MIPAYRTAKFARNAKKVLNLSILRALRGLFFFWLIGIFLLALAACASPQHSPTPQPAPTEHTALPPATQTIKPPPTLEVLPTPVLSEIKGPETETPTASPTPKPCLSSPLAVQPLDKISEITTQPFKMPRIMPNGSYKDDAHHGVDLGYYTRDKKLFTGTPVLAALNGVIAAIIHNRPPYGNMLMIETPHSQIPQPLREKIPAEHSLYSVYGHLQNLQPLAPGDAVTCGQQIAETGLTGFTSGPHLHFETRHGPAGQSFDSIAYYRADATKPELANYERWRMSGEFVLFNPMELLAP